MRTILKFLVSFSIVMGIAIAQVGPQQIIQTAPVPNALTQLSTTVIGSQGNSTYYYWIAIHYPIGIVISGPFQVGNAFATFGGGNSIRLNWTAQTSATSYDILRTFTPNSFTGGGGSCTACVVTTGLTTVVFTDSTVTPSGNFTLTSPVQSGFSSFLNNRDYSAPHLVYSTLYGPKITIDFTGVNITGLPSGSSVAGSDTQVQFNQMGSFGASSQLTYNYTAHVLNSQGGISTGTSPPNVVAGTGGVIAGAEGTVPSVCAASGVDCIYFDSATHQPLISNNGGNFVPLGGVGGTPGSPVSSFQYNNAGSFGGMSGSSWDDSIRAAVFLDASSNQLLNFAANAVGANGCGIFYVNCDGAAPASVSTSPGLNGGFIGLDMPQGGTTTITTTGIGGNGGGFTSAAGNGADISTALTSGTAGNGGSYTFSPGSGGNCTNGATCIGGNAGTFNVNLKPNGTGSTSNGTDSAFNIVNNGSSNVFKVTRSGTLSMIQGATGISSSNPTIGIYLNDATTHLFTIYDDGGSGHFGFFGSHGSYSCFGSDFGGGCAINVNAGTPRIALDQFGSIGFTAGNDATSGLDVGLSRAGINTMSLDAITRGDSQGRLILQTINITTTFFTFNGHTCTIVSTVVTCP